MDIKDYFNKLSSEGYTLDEIMELISAEANVWEASRSKIKWDKPVDDTYDRIINDEGTVEDGIDIILRAKYRENPTYSAEFFNELYDGLTSGVNMSFILLEKLGLK